MGLSSVLPEPLIDLRDVNKSKLDQLDQWKFLHPPYIGPGHGRSGSNKCTVMCSLGALFVYIVYLGCPFFAVPTTRIHFGMIRVLSKLCRMG